MSKKTLAGKVIRIGSGKTAVVSISYTVRHPRYQKVLKRSKRYLVENVAGARVGDLVRIVESRPLSRNKCFLIEKIGGQE